METIEILFEKKLPIEIINMILSFRERHPVAKIVLPFIPAYKLFVDKFPRYWEDTNYDFRHFSQVYRIAIFMQSVKCDTVQKHFTKKWEKIKNECPFATHHYTPSSVREYVNRICADIRANKL